MMSPSVWHFSREHGPGAAPVLLAWGRTGCSACRKVAGPHVCLAGPQRGWQVGHHQLAGFYTELSCSPEWRADPHRWWQVPEEGDQSPQTVAGLLQVGKFLHWAAWSPMEECRPPWQVPTTFPNSTGDVLLQFAGVWHVTAIASNCSIFLKMKDGMKSSIAIISFMPERDLAMKLVWPL